MGYRERCFLYRSPFCLATAHRCVSFLLIFASSTHTHAATSVALKPRIISMGILKPFNPHHHHAGMQAQRNCKRRSQVPTGAPCEHPPPNPAPATAPPRSMRRGKKGSNKKGKVRTAPARRPPGATHLILRFRSSIHAPALAYCLC